MVSYLSLNERCALIPAEAQGSRWAVLPGGSGAYKAGCSAQRPSAISPTMQPLILCCYIIKMLLLLQFPPLRGLNPFLFRPACGEFLRDIPLLTRTAMASLAKCRQSFQSFSKRLFIFPSATLWRTLNRTFNSPHRRGSPLNDDTEREIPSLPSLAPFRRREASPRPRNQTWLPAGGQCWRSWAEKQGGYRELGFPPQIKSSVKPFSFTGDWIYDRF